MPRSGLMGRTIGMLDSVDAATLPVAVLLLIMGPFGRKPGCSSWRSPTKPITSTTTLSGGGDGSSTASMLLWSAWLRRSCSVLVLGVLVYSRLLQPTPQTMTSVKRILPTFFIVTG